MQLHRLCCVYNGVISKPKSVVFYGSLLNIVNGILYKMEKFKDKCLEEIKKLEESHISKVLTKTKFDNIVSALIGDLKDKELKKHIHVKDYRLINLSDLGLTDVLAKEQL